MVILHELSVTERAWLAGDNGPFDLPVNPVSFLLLHIRADATVGAVDLNQLLGHITGLTISFKGTQIIAMNGVDLFRLVHRLLGRGINIEGFNAVAPALISITIPIPFSRKPYWEKEAFPATRRGEFTVSLQRSALLTNLANPVFSIEAVQLLEAEPVQFLKMVTLSRAIVAGDADFELPIGNPFLGLQVFSPTGMGNAPISETIRRMRLLLDNVEYDYGDTAFDVSRALGFLRSTDNNEYSGITSPFRNHTYLEFDPMMDEKMMVETDGRASVRLRFIPDVAGTVRVTPVELVRLGAAAGGA
ncbi:MAG: hypothetical protein ACREU0_01730 [Burkholderiales bacterium]